MPVLKPQLNPFDAAIDHGARESGPREGHPAIVPGAARHGVFPGHPQHVVAHQKRNVRQNWGLHHKRHSASDAGVCRGPGRAGDRLVGMVCLDTREPSERVWGRRRGWG